MTKARILESRGNAITPFTGCAQISHQRWYVRPSGTPAEGIVCLRQPTGDATLPLRRKKRAYPFVNFAFRQKPKCGFYLPTKSMSAPLYPIARM